MLVAISGCVLSSNQTLNWSENIAIRANSKNSKFHDDNLYTEGRTSTIVEENRSQAAQEESDKYTEAVLNWNVPQAIQQIVVKAKEGQLEFFHIQYMDEEGKWVTIKDVRENMRPVYKYTLRDPILTKKFRLKVPRRWESRRIGGQSRSKRSETGAPSAAEYKNIQEIELYYALPTPETTSME